MVIHKIGILNQIFPKSRNFVTSCLNCTCFSVIGSGAQRYCGVISTNNFHKPEEKNLLEKIFPFPPRSVKHFLHQGRQQYFVATTATIQGQSETSILKLVMTFSFSGSSLFERYNITKDEASATLLSSRSNGFKNIVISNLPLFYRGRYYFFKMFPYSLGVNDPPPPTQLNSVS